MIEVTVNRPNLVIETNVASVTGPIGAQGPSGPTGTATSEVYQNLSTFLGTTVPSSAQSVVCLAYATAGDLVGYPIHLKRISAPLTATNRALWARDLTNAAWVKTNVTAALNQTGYDGAANSATLLTATANNGTILQSITLAGVNVMTAFVRRVTGTGDISMTTDNGAHWTVLPLATNYQRLEVIVSLTGATQIGFKIATSGDQIVVDCVQNEDSALSPPIPTTTTAVTAVLPWCLRSTDRFLPNGSTDNTNGGYWTFTNQVVTPEMFGAPAIGSAPYDDWPAITNAICFAMKHNRAGAHGQSVRVHLPSMTYYCSQTIMINGDFAGGGPIAFSGSHPSINGNGTKIHFPVDTCGIHARITAFSVKIEDLFLQGVNGSGVGAHGFYLKTIATVKNFSVYGFSNHGIYLQSGDGSNQDSSYFENILIDFAGQDGLHIDGSDSQVCLFNMLRIYNVGGCAIWDTAYYPNQYKAVDIAGNGLPGYQTRSDSVGGVCKGSDTFTYMVRPGQDAAASTTDPATDNGSVWLRIPDAPSYGALAWVSGHKYKCGCAIYTSTGSTFDFIYTESGYSLPSFIVAGISFGGGFNACTDVGFIDPSISMNSNYIRFAGGFSVDEKTSLRNTDPAGHASGIHNYVGGNPDRGDAFATFDDYTGGSYKINWDRSTKDVVVNCGPYGAEAIRFVCGNSTFKGGNSTNVLDYNTAVFYHGVGIGSGDGFTDQTRIIKVLHGGSPPSTGENVTGNVLVNSAASKDAPAFYVCTTSGVGGAQAWSPMYLCQVPIYPTTTVGGLASYTPIQGARCFVTDANATTYLSIVAAGGANKVPVIYNGTNWVIG